MIFVTRQYSRRHFFRDASAATAALALGSQLAVPADAKPVDYGGFANDVYLGGVEILARVEDEKVFTEGPAVDAAGNVLFMNVSVSKILLWDPRARELSVNRENTHETNRLYFASDGSVDQIRAFPQVHMPNGIVTSPDSKKRYLIEAHPDADHHRDIRVYDLNDDGKLEFRARLSAIAI